MKQSQAFAAFRTSLITDKNHAILNELVPSFNAQCEDIRRRVDTDFSTYNNRAKADNLGKSLTYDLVLSRKQVIDNVQKDMTERVNDRLAFDGANLRREDIDGKSILTAEFPDGSTARVPQKLWIDYGVFDRV